VRLSGAGGQVVVVDLDGHEQVVSGSDKVHSKALAWTPDGRILYAADIDASPIRNALRVVSPDGGEVSTVWEGPVIMVGVSSVAGLDDGRILFLNDDGLMVVNRDGSELHPIGSVVAARPGPFWARAFAVSPDHRRVATIANDGLAMFDISTGTTLATGSGATGNAILEWSSDSRRVAYSGGVVLNDDGTVTRTGAADVAFPATGMAISSWRNDGSADDGAVELVAADGSRRIVTRQAWDIAGGPTLAAIIAPPDNPHRGVPRAGTTLCLLGHPRALAAFPNSEPNSMSWSPDGRYLSVVTVRLDSIISPSP
jgi:WD40 repeat protein